MPRKKGAPMNERERERFRQFLDRKRAEKQRRAEEEKQRQAQREWQQIVQGPPEPKPPPVATDPLEEDWMPDPPPANTVAADGTVYCPSGDHWVIPERMVGIQCDWHRDRHNRFRPLRRAGVALPESSPLGRFP
jgi:hypothetical protein